MLLDYEYNLNALNEIRTTDSFLSMNKDLRKCQGLETFDECLDRNFLSNLQEACKCLPLSLSLPHSKVPNISDFPLCPSYLQVPLCTTEDAECLSTVVRNETECLPKCTGIQVTSYTKEHIDKNINLLQSMDAYNSLVQEFLQTQIIKNGLKWKMRLPPSITSKSTFSQR